MDFFQVSVRELRLLPHCRVLTAGMNTEAMSQCESSLSHAADESRARARDRLFVLLYEDLHRMARRELQRHAPATLGPTTLLHETFLNVCQRDSVSAVERGPFMSYAARAMRGLIVDYFRSRATRKRGGDLEIT